MSHGGRHPNAKTYKDKQGNIRQVGTGKLVRRAGARPRPRGKTFTDGQGVLRRIGGVAVNPLDRRVDAAILQQTAPLTNRIGQSNSQYDAERAAVTGAGEALGSELQALQQRISGLGAQQLGAAASAAGGTADQQQANLDYLRNLVGGSMQDASALPGAVTALAAQAQGEGAGAAADLMLGQRGIQNDLGAIGGAAAMQSRGTIQERLLARNAALRDYQDQIAAIKANRWGVRNDLIDRSLDQQAARQQIRLSQAEFDENRRQFDESLEAQREAAEMEAAAAAESGSGGGSGSDSENAPPGRWGSVRLTKDQTLAVQTEINRWRAAPAKQKSLSSLITYIRRGAGGVNGTQAARIAWAILGPTDMKRYAKSRQAFLRVMANAGVNERVRTAWANKVWGNRPTRPIPLDPGLRPDVDRPSGVPDRTPPKPTRKPRPGLVWVKRPRPGGGWYWVEARPAPVGT